jgi:long-chain acyl-CoA synthetase
VPSFPNWGRNRAVCHIRRGIQAALLFPAMRWMYRLDVSGLENLADVKSPVIIAPNHQLLLDNPLLIKAMPLRVRRRLAIAGWDELWKSRFSGFTNTLVGNGFPFSKGGAVRHSFENLGKILDEGWSVMIFPEGELTVGGPMKPFLSGVGLISVEGNVPVVPVRLEIRRVGFPKHFPVFRRGHVEIHFGKSRVFNADVPYDEAARAIERAVAEL